MSDFWKGRPLSGMTDNNPVIVMSDVAGTFSLINNSSVDCIVSVSDDATDPFQDDWYNVSFSQGMGAKLASGSQSSPSYAIGSTNIRVLFWPSAAQSGDLPSAGNLMVLQGTNTPRKDNNKFGEDPNFLVVLTGSWGTGNKGILTSLTMTDGGPGTQFSITNNSKEGWGLVFISDMSPGLYGVLSQDNWAIKIPAGYSRTKNIPAGASSSTVYVPSEASLSASLVFPQNGGNPGDSPEAGVLTDAVISQILDHAGDNILNFTLPVNLRKIGMRKKPKLEFFYSPGSSRGGNCNIKYFILFALILIFIFIIISRWK